MREKEVRTSSDLIRWLKMLALPTWAKFGLALIMRLVHQRHLVVRATPDHSASGIFIKPLHENFLREPGILEASTQHA